LNQLNLLNPLNLYWGSPPLLGISPAAAPPASVQVAELRAISEHDLREKAERAATCGSAHGDGHFVAGLE
jgi:hypothetical protein